MTTPVAGPVFPDSVDTLAALFSWRVTASPNGAAYRQFDTFSKDWLKLDWREIGERVDKWLSALASQQYEAGARVAILLPNGIHAVCIDQAALALGLVPVPLHAIDNPESIAYILADSEARILVLQDAAQWNAISALEIDLPALHSVVVTGVPPADHQSGPRGARVLGLAEWLAQGETAAPVTRTTPRAEDLAALVYTSGTTGKPKGVMLTHRNVLENVRAVLKRVVPVEEDVFLSFLPLSHTFERTAGYYLAIACGCCVTYVRSVAQIGEDLLTVRPTMLVSVPRIYERFYARIQTAVQQSRVKNTLFDMAVTVGWRRFCRRQGIAVESAVPAVVDMLAWLALEPLVARPIRAQLGGRIRVAVSGGAPLGQAIARCFLGLGLPLLQGYGMTETAPIVSANGVDDNWPETVGKPLVGVEVRIGENRELQVRAPSVMRGYWKRPEDTARTMMEDGWLRTGDQAAIENGRIRILGRIKEIIVTSTGEKIAPADLELAIAVDPLFDQVMVIGENRPFISAFVVLNAEQWAALAKELGVAADAASLTIPAVRQALEERIQAATRSFPRYAVPRVVRASLEQWTVQNALMTPTLKIKRLNLEKHYAAEIDDVYRSGKH